MRIRFHEGPLLEVHAAISQWWNAFARNAGRLAAYFSEGRGFDVVGFMNEHLGAVDPRLMWEFGPALEGREHRLIFTPERERHLRPLTDALLAAAPRDTGFEFYFGRLAESVSTAAATVKSRAGLSIEGWQVAIEPNDALGLIFKVVPRPGQVTAQRIVEAANIALEILLGEALLDTWCDDIEISSREATAVPIENVVAQTRKAIATLREQTPPRPLHEFAADAEWSILKLEPKAADDYALQSDLLVGKTMYLPMWRAAQSRTFFSERYSRFGETFCFLKLDGTEALKEGFEDKVAIEDALEGAFAGTGLGAVIGGGTGLRYSYIDLALTDVERAVPILRETLQRGQITRRCWLQFFDDTLAAEWVGMWPDSPPPPGLPD